MSPDELVNIKGKKVVVIGFSNGFGGSSIGEKFSGERHLPIIKGIKGVDWFENYYTFTISLKLKKISTTGIIELNKNCCRFQKSG